MCGYDGYLTQVFILSRAGVTWITYSGYISPLCWINNCHTPKGYAVTLKIWVLSGLVCFGGWGGGGVVVFGIIYIKTGLYTVSSGRPLPMATFSRDNKYK